MADAAVKIKIMPASPDTNLEEIETKAKEIIENLEGKVFKSEKEPIAFGLNAIILTLGIIETFDQDLLLDKLRAIENVSSAEVVDFRRAFG